jgi:hypothetical protein
MRQSRRSHPATALYAALAVLALAGCTTSNAPQPPTAAAPAVVPTLPPAFPPEQLVGRWGLTAYHNPDDRARTVKAAAGQCRNPYVITLGPTGGVMMHLADQSTPSELALKGAPGGKTYVGPKDEPPGSMQDREVVSFDGRVLILHWVDPEVQSRYGTMVYVRCGPQRHKRSVQRKPTPTPKPVPKPKPR